MTREELARHDGKEGRKACVAVGGKVYDFTGSNFWRDGNHEGAHGAGCDLTGELRRAPHVRAVVERFPVIGYLDEEVAGRGGLKGWLVLAGAAAVVLLAALMLLR